MSKRVHRNLLGWVRTALLVAGIVSLSLNQLAAQATASHFVVAPSSTTVSDTATQLTWQRSAPSQTYDWKSATKYCAQLELDGKGWRLPTIKELHTLVDESRVMPAIDVSAFPAAVSDYYWSSSQVPGFLTETWTVGFAYGFDGFFGVDTGQHVRCVR